MTKKTYNVLKISYNEVGADLNEQDHGMYSSQWLKN
jgi:hypothetical protein